MTITRLADGGLRIVAAPLPRNRAIARMVGASVVCGVSSAAALTLALAVSDGQWWQVAAPAIAVVMLQVALVNSIMTAMRATQVSQEVEVDEQYLTIRRPGALKVIVVNIPVRSVTDITTSKYSPGERANGEIVVGQRWGAGTRLFPGERYSELATAATALQRALHLPAKA